MSKEKHKNLEDFAKQLRISVDSRIQKVEYNMSKVIMPYVPSLTDNHRSDSQSKTQLPTFKSPKLYNEKLFNLIEDYTNRVCKLMYIRSKITHQNALDVRKLLETEDYLKWDKKRLKSFLEESFNTHQD